MKKHNKKQHKSVALAYNDALPAPIIVASGRAKAAQRIDTIAKEAGVPIIKEEILAEGLEIMDIGSLVPAEYWEILAKVFIILRKVQK